VRSSLHRSKRWLIDRLDLPPRCLPAPISNLSAQQAFDCVLVHEQQNKIRGRGANLQTDTSPARIEKRGALQPRPRAG